MMEAYQPNRPIAGDYDPACAARCGNGTFVGRTREGVTVFRGIPFAAPPVGPLRWREPAPVRSSDGVFEALHNGPTAIQTKLDSERASFYYQSEDCLYLNVWTADGFAGQKRPVMVFIHGGNYGWGGTVDPLYDGHNFVKAHPGVVLVTIAYRVGIFGFMDFSEVPGGEAYSTSGNLGLLDQICALRWLQNNLPAFGGNPRCVTVFGESAGAGSVSLLPLIPAAGGLFRRVIAQSGSVALTYSREECLPLTRKLLKAAKATRMEELLALSEKQLKAINETVGTVNNFPERDGVLLPKKLYEAYERGLAQPVELLIGTNADELRYWILDVGGLVPYRQMSYVLFDSTVKQMRGEDRQRAEVFLRRQAERGLRARPWQITEFFNELLFRLPAVRQAEAHAAHGNRTYMYYWRQPSAIPHLRACHAVELAYVFGNLHETIYTGTGADAALSAQVQQMWVNFATRGDPSVDGLPWKPYSRAARHTMLLGGDSRLEQDWREPERKSLTPLLSYHINGNSTDLSVDYTPILKAAAIAVGAGLTAFLLWRLLRTERKG